MTYVEWIFCFWLIALTVFYAAFALHVLGANARLTQHDADVDSVKAVLDLIYPPVTKFSARLDRLDTDFVAHITRHSFVQAGGTDWRNLSPDLPDPDPSGRPAA